MPKKFKPKKEGGLERDFERSLDAQSDLLEKVFKENVRLKPEDCEILGLDTKFKAVADYVAQTKESAKSFQEKYQDVLHGRMDPPVSYDDGDQSPLKGEKAQFLRNQWAEGMDYNPSTNPWVSDWCKVLWCGDYQGMMDILRNKTEEETKKLLMKRETFLSVCSVLHVVIGAKNLCTENDPNLRNVQLHAQRTMNVRKEYKKCLLRLLSLGADVNVKDVAGYTPLHHCAQMYSNDVTLALAQILLKAGANVDAKNRFGDTPLMYATMASKFEVIQVLLDHGADPYAGEYTANVSANQIAQRFPRIQEMFGKANQRKMKSDRKVVRETVGISECNVCKTQDKGKKRCTGCYCVFYCGRECQVKDWDKHKEDCKTYQEEYKPCVVQSSLFGQVPMTKNNITGAVFQPTTKVSEKSHFVVKVDICCEFNYQMMIVRTN